MNNEPWLDSVREDALDPQRPLIDAHHHLWDRPDFRYMGEELLADMAGGHDFRATVYMEIETGYRAGGPEHLRPVGETEFTNKLADAAAAKGKGAARLCAGIVGYANLSLGEKVGETLDAHIAAAPRRFRGIRERLALQDQNIFKRPAPAHPYKRLNDPAFRTGLSCLAPRQLSLDVFVYHPQIPDLAALAGDFPDTSFILNHLGTPLGVGPYAGKREDEVWAAWKKDVADLARCPNVTVKLGGMGMFFNGFGWEKRPRPPGSEELAAATHRWFLHTIDCFGPSRCMFESNFPVDRLSAPMGVLWNSFKRIVAGFSETEKSALFYGTAARVYRLDPQLL